MAKTNTIMNTWTRGELTPYLDGRTDIQQYYNGAKTIENFFILPHGGLKRRPGTYYVAETETMTEASRLIPFQFSTTQAYIIEVGDQYMRFYKDRGQILDGASPYELATPYLEADIFDLQFVQDADTMYIVHPSYKPRKLTRTGHTSWTLTNYAPTADPFGADDSDDCPSCVAIYEQRLMFANTNNDPQKIWGSVSGNYDDMTTGTNDGDAYVYTLGSKRVNAIRWLSDSDVLYIGTLGSVFKLWSGSNDDPVTPSNVSVKRISSFGSASLLPKELGDFVYYLERNNKIIREISYNYDYDKTIPSEITILSDHITSKNGIVDMDYQQSPYSMLWCVRGDGQIATLTRQVEQQVAGWARIVTDGEFESVAVIPGDGSDDEVWVIVKRYIDGAYVRYVEYFKPTIYDDQEDGFFVDCGLTLDSPLTITDITNTNPAVVTSTGHGLSNGDTITIRNVVGMTELNGNRYKVANKTDNTFELTDEDDADIDSTAYGVYLSGGEARECVSSLSGLDHLEGKSAAICGDGAALDEETVDTGAVTLADSYGELHAGLPFTSTLQTMRLEAGQESGTAQGKLKKISKVDALFFETVGCNVGTPDSQDAISFRDADDDAETAIPLFTGKKELVFPGSFDEDGYLYLTQDQPLPMNLLALILFFTTNEP